MYTTLAKAAHRLVLEDARRGARRARNLSNGGILLNNSVKKLPRVGERLTNDMKEHDPIAAAKKAERELKKERKSINMLKRRHSTNE